MNPLTGDFDAVVQVAGRTINRLMATLHQNADTSTKLPTHPHAISLPITASDNAEGVSGWLSAQIGVPQIILLDRRTDRLDLEIGLRARFLADAGSAELPEYIHGTVRATYQITEVDRSCWGWQLRADNYLWLRVVKDSVRFNGTATDDLLLPADPGAKARIERVVADLLDNRFEAAPHPVSPEFQPGQMISLNPGGQDAVALPIDLAGGSPPGGQVSSITEVFVGEHDFAVAIASEWLLAQLQPIFDQFATPIEIRRNVPARVYGLGIKLGTIEIPIDVTAQMTVSPVDWSGYGYAGSIHFVLNGEIRGTVNATFTAEVVVGIYFDSYNESLGFFLHGGYPDVRVYPDVPWIFGVFGVDDVIENQIRDQIRAAVSDAVRHLPEIPLAAYHEKLSNQQGSGQLQTLDEEATASFISADFRQEAIVLHGSVGLTARRPPVVEFTKLQDGTGFSALNAWAPGGWIERFVWTYRPDYQTEQSRTLQDRYVLIRQPGIVSRWGKQLSNPPVTGLPGIDGSGEICLEIQGFQIDSVTGNRISFRARTCKLFGRPLSVARNDHVGRLLTTLRSAPEPEGRSRELGVMELSSPRVQPGATNSLVVYASGSLDGETTHTLAAGLAASERDDAGLAVLLIVDENNAAARGTDIAEQVDALSEDIGAHIQIIENVAQSWTRRLAMPPGEAAWRLITPNGGFTWAHDGSITSDELAAVLDGYLRPGPPPTFDSVGAAVVEGSAVSPWTVTGTVLPGQQRHCPRIYTVPRSYFMGFVRAGSQPSEDQLTEWQRARAAGPSALPPLLAVVDGDSAQASQISERHPHVEVIPDPSGVISDRFGVRIWPTIVGIEDGLVTGVRYGLVEYDAPAPVSWNAESPSTRQRRSGDTAT